MLFDGMMILRRQASKITLGKNMVTRFFNRDIVKKVFVEDGHFMEMHGMC